MQRVLDAVGYAVGAGTVGHDVADDLHFIGDIAAAGVERRNSVRRSEGVALFQGDVVGADDLGLFLVIWVRYAFSGRCLLRGRKIWFP